MSTLNSAANSLVPTVAYPGLLPIRFGFKPYMELCQKFDAALADLEARYPGIPRAVTLETRNKLLKRRPK